MSFSDIISVIFEFSLICFTIWAMLHEDRFIAFEEKYLCRFKRRKFKVVEKNNIHTSTFNLQHQ